MCELFGISGREKINVREYLKEFYSHSIEHPHGWGMAVFYGDIASVEKEPVQAMCSTYLRERLRGNMETRVMLAHIRLATVGSMDYENCHPFVKKDISGRHWTLIHNGTMFDCPVLDSYFYQQEGRTDSERILFYFVDMLNKEQEKKGSSLAPEERFGLLNRLICNMAEGNKMNLLLYDGEYMYVHTNYADSLYYRKIKEGILFSTRPLKGGGWEPVQMCTLLAFKDGEQAFVGTNHGQEYIDNEKDMQFLFLDSASL